MSQTNSANADDDLEQYRGTAGAEVKTTDVSSDENPLKAKLGSEDASKERQYDPKIAGERFVQFYDDTAASIREYLSNAETACIRRAKAELRDAGFSDDEIPDEVREMIDMAKEECGYDPLIEVTYNRKEDEPRLVIEDNGIGISTEEYQVVQRIGYSTSHDEGSRLGNFGMGWMSGFQLTSINGLFKMKTRSYLTDEAYGTIEYVANCEFLDASPDDYGTQFEFPSFGEAAKQISIPDKVSEFAEGMTITVLYRDFDESGSETRRSDEFLATAMEEDYADDSMVITYENEYFKAAMSPDRKENGRGLTTYNISMPIRRNTDKFGSSNKFGAPWKWDFRAKQEDGPIVHCPSNEELVGLVPKEDTKYDRLMDDLQEKCVPMSRVPSDAIVMPQPASSRDSFKGGHDDFWKHVADKLTDEWAEVARERFVDLDSWDAFLDLDREQKELLFRAYSKFGPGYGTAEPDTIQETLEDELDVTVPKKVCERLHKSQSKVSVVSRGSNRAHTKGATYRERIWKVIDEAPDGVYMAKTVSQKKADIVWGLGDTHVIRLTGDDETYEEYEQDWGWEKAKDLPSRSLEDKLPELDQDVIDKYEDTSASDSNNTSNTGGDGKNPETYRLKARVGSRASKYFSVFTAKNLKETLEDGDTFQSGYYHNMEYLLLYDDDTNARTVGNRADRHKNIAGTTVPEYVYDYLEGTQNVYTDKQELYDDVAGTDVELSDGTTMDIRDVPESDVLINTEDRIEEMFEDRPQDLLDHLGVEGDFDRYTFINGSDLDGSWDVDTDARVIKTSGSSTRGLESFEQFSDYSYVDTNFDDLRLQDKLGGMDEDSDEYEALFGYRYGEPSGETLDTLIQIAQDAGLTDD